MADAGGGATSETKLTRPSFDGNRKHFQVWWTRYKAFAMVAGFMDMLTTSKPTSLPTAEDARTGTDEEKEQQGKAVKRNAIAIAHFTMAFKAESLMALIYRSQTTDWPTGQAYIVVAALYKKYRPDDMTAKIEMNHELAKVRMKHDEDPSTLFEKMCQIENQFNMVMTDAEKIALVIGKAPVDYASVITSEQRRDPLGVTVVDIEEVMKRHHRLTRRPTDEDDDEEEESGDRELALSAFKGICYICKQPGHKANECPNKQEGHQASQQSSGNNQYGRYNRPNNDRGNRFSGKCNICGKTGHRAADCWESSDNKDRRPAWFVPKGEVGAVAVPRHQTRNEDKGEEESEESVEYFLTTAPNLMFNNDREMLTNPNVWIADSGASKHMTAHIDGMRNLKKTSTTAVWGNGEKNTATYVGEIPGIVCNKNGIPKESVVLRNVDYVPNSAFNLFSLTRMQLDGWRLYGDKHGIRLTKGEAVFNFDIGIKTAEGIVYCMYISRTGEMGNVAMKKKTKVSITEVHAKLGHINEDTTRMICKTLGWEISRGKLGVCESCTVGKAKRKNLPKTEKKELQVGEIRMYTDIATVKKKKDMPIPTRPHWCIKVLEPYGIKLSHFYKKKSDMVEPACEMLHQWKEMGIKVTHIRLDNAGENYKLQERCKSKDWKLAVQWEFTSRNTPQQNSNAEVGFWTIQHRGLAIMHAANVPKFHQYKLYTEAFTTACKLDWLVPITINGITKTRYEHWQRRLPVFVEHLRTWGEAGTVTYTANKQPKLVDRGRQCMFVGYEDDHGGDCYRMWFPETNKVLVTRDVIWLQRMFFVGRGTVFKKGKVATKDDGKGKRMIPPTNQVIAASEDEISLLDGVMSAGDVQTEKKVVPEEGIQEEMEIVFYEEEKEDEPSNEEDDDDSGNDINEQEKETDSEQSNEESDDRSDDEEEDEKSNEDEEDDHECEKGKIENNEKTTRPKRHTQQPYWLRDYVAGVVMDTLNCSEDKTVRFMGNVSRYSEEIAGVGLGTAFMQTQELQTITYEECMRGSEKEHWEKAIEEEYKKMKDNEVFLPVPKSEVPANAKILTSKWVMKKKANGTYRARITARGYEQVNGQHYDEYNKAAPVVDDLTIRVVLVLIIMANWCAELVDVRGAFLTGTFEEGHKVYMEVPKGFHKWYGSDVWLLLMRTIYGTKQAAHQFWVLLVKVFQHMKYERSVADPCLYYNWTEKHGLVVWMSWVDDCLCAGTAAGVQEAKEAFKNHFEVDDLGPIEEYVGCKITFDSKRGSMKLTQPVLLQSLRDEFNIVEKGLIPTTPAAPGEVLNPVEPSAKIGPHDQFLYRSGVGKLIHLAKWSRPEIGNAVRELSRFMREACPIQVKALHRTMRYCIHTPERGLTLAPDAKWDGSRDFKFTITGYSDANYAAHTEGRRSVSGYAVFMNTAPLRERSRTQRCVTLSVTEAELIAAVECVQDMIRAKQVLESMGLRVQIPMTLHVDNQGTVDLINNWSVGGRTRHVDVRCWYLRELKEEKTLRVEWISTTENVADLFTKNLSEPIFNKHITAFVTDNNND